MKKTQNLFQRAQLLQGVLEQFRSKSRAHLQPHPPLEVSEGAGREAGDGAG